MRPDGAGDEGVYFRRPDWTQIRRYEQSLIGAVPEIAAVR